MPDMTTAAAPRRTRRAIFATAAATGAVLALRPALSSADTAAGSPVLLGRKNGGFGVSATTTITNSAGVGKPTLLLKNGADAGTGLRSIADLALDAQGNINVAGRSRLAGAVAIAGAKSVTMSSGAAVNVPFAGLDEIPDTAAIVATVNSAGAPAVASAVKTGPTTVRVTLTAAVASATRVSVLVLEPSL